MVLIAKVGRRLPKILLRYLQDYFVYHPVMRQKNISIDRPPLFDTVFFEVRTRCNGRCAFCRAAVGSDTRPDLSMPIELYVKVLRELAEIGFAGRIAYHNNSEPLLFKDLYNYIKLAKRIIPKAYIQILTNGRALTMEKAKDLIDAGISELNINYYNDDLNAELPPVFHEIAKVVLPKYFMPDEMEVVLIGRKYINPKPIFRYYLTRRLENQVLTSRAGSAPNKKVPDSRPRGFCQYPFTQFIITADGRVSMCCADVNFDEPAGNVAVESVLDVWHGESYRRFRNALLLGNREPMKTCRQCDFYGVKRPPNTSIGRYIYYITQ